MNQNKIVHNSSKLKHKNNTFQPNKNSKIDKYINFITMKINYKINWSSAIV